MKNLQRYCTSGFAAEFLVHQPRAGRGPHPEPTSCLSARFFVVKNKQARSKTTEVGRQTKRRRNGQTAERAGRGKKRRLRRRSSDLNFMRLLRGGQGCGNCTLCLQCLHLAAPPSPPPPPPLRPQITKKRREARAVADVLVSPPQQAPTAVSKWKTNK